MTIADTVDGFCFTRPGERHGLCSQTQAELLWSTSTRLLQRDGQGQDRRRGRCIFISGKGDGCNSEASLTLD